MIKPFLSPGQTEKLGKLKMNALIVPLTFGRARIVCEWGDFEYAREFW